MIFSFTKMYLKVSSAKWRPFCLDLNVLTWESPYLERALGEYWNLHKVMWSHGNISCITGPLWGESLVLCHYKDVIMATMSSQITSLKIVYSIVYSDADQSKYQSSASLAFVCGIHRRPVNSPHKWPVTWKMFPFDDVNMVTRILWS